MRKYGIVADTSCETSESITEKYGVVFASFKIDVDHVTYVDDENLDLDALKLHAHPQENLKQPWKKQMQKNYLSSPYPVSYQVHMRALWSLGICFWKNTQNEKFT